MFQDNLPPEVFDLEQFLKRFKEKDSAKAFDIEDKKKRAFDKL